MQSLDCAAILLRMSYSDVDPDIKAWCREHGLSLCTEYNGQDRRFCYVPGGPGECFLIAIEPPHGDNVVIDACAVETDDDAELYETWTQPTDRVRAGLKAALIQIEAWKVRPRGVPQAKPHGKSKARHAEAWALDPRRPTVTMGRCMFAPSAPPTST
jgi:hypothetical protein